MGRLSGTDTELETIDGRIPYAVGDRVVIRETIWEAGLLNGSVGTVRGIDGTGLEIERQDGEIVRVETQAHRECNTGTVRQNTASKAPPAMRSCSSSRSTSTNDL